MRMRSLMAASSKIRSASSPLSPPANAVTRAGAGAALRATKLRTRCDYNCSTSTFKVDELREWSRCNPSVARDATNPPPPPPPSSSSAEELRSIFLSDDDDGIPPDVSGDDGGCSPTPLERYLQARGWELPPRLSDGLLHGGGDDECDDRAAAVALASHPLSFPLTLAAHLVPAVLSEAGTTPPHTEDEDRGGGKKKARPLLRIGCVGARAEATLPDGFWREFLIVSGAMACGDGDGAVVDWQMDVVGPDVPSGLARRPISLLGVDGDGGRRREDGDASWHVDPNRGSKDDDEKDDDVHFGHAARLSMSCHRGYWHDFLIQNGKVHTVASIPIAPMWDGFVLFNPGLGHPNLRAGWAPTMELLLRSAKPILLTSHSEEDGRRDLDALRDLLVTTELASGAGNVDPEALEYAENPWSSRMETEDPLASRSQSTSRKSMVRANHSFLLIPGRETRRGGRS